MASAPPLAKHKDPPATPLSEPTPKNPRTSASTRQWVSASTSTSQAKSPSSSKKEPSVVAIQTGFSLPPSDTAQPVADTGPSAQPEAQSAPAVQQPSVELAPSTQSAQDTPAESAQPTPSAAGPSFSTDRHDQLFNLVMETRDKQKELKEMMKQLMAFWGMPPPPPSPPLEPPLQQQPAPSSPLAAPLDKGKTIKID
ncbi:predicted GPI-anchored protein 58 [Hevea brasiliensis]|uniref:predicted GPI-anchored protein 58 n=1 Tax=Hevea brasiliensis TaxID=3981 RepID=UPI0025ECC7D4|nr:predicted GPI-anchored protein 58 [Hevea brasiliensis]